MKKQDQISETAIALLVRRFYTKVHGDPLLAPVFHTALGFDRAAWEPHLQVMDSFWSSVMLTSGRYKGNPVAVHLALPRLTPAMFERWLALFAETAHEVFAEPLAEAFVAKAHLIATSLQSALNRLGPLPSGRSPDMTAARNIHPPSIPSALSGA